MTKSEKRVKPDNKGRITLGAWAEGVSSFIITKDKKNRIILEPYAEVPAHELWVYEHKESLGKIKRGLQDAAHGNLSTLGDFTQFVNDES